MLSQFPIWRHRTGITKFEVVFSLYRPVLVERIEKNHILFMGFSYSLPYF